MNRLQRLCAQNGVNDSYPAAAISEAHAWLERPGVDDAALDDLTDLAFCTIDNPDSRDLDQALHLCRDAETGGVVLRYALADASYFVRPNTALFEEALRRGSSYYLPDRSFPMLPRVLSEDLISLNPGVNRRALVVELHLDPAGMATHTRLYRARIRSRAKLSYPGVQAFYDGDPTLAGRDFTDTLERLREVGERRIALARAAGVIHFDRGPRLRVDAYNEQISLLCNVEGARLLAQTDNPAIQGVFRVHPSPPPERLEALATLTRELCKIHRLSPELWQWDRTQSLGDYLDKLPRGRVAQAIEHQALMSNVRSSFDAAPAPHFGVGAKAYARFTAPMREIVGIFTHKEALELVLGGSAPDPEDQALRERVIDAGNRSKALQRRIEKEAARMEIDALLEADMQGQRPWRLGTVMGLRPTRTYVQLDSPPIDVKVYGRPPRGIAPGHAVELRPTGTDSKGRWRFEMRRP